jgi:acyl-CoA synthetase (AMP-forming)/AMP-acid ligase II
LKEIINRGGEKIAPLEVDEVLLAHDAVAQACTFAMPHARLGEEVAAAVVLADGADVTDRDLRDFVAERLADFKTPRRFAFVDEIPKGPTGKIQRIGLAKALGFDS